LSAASVATGLAVKAMLITVTVVAFIVLMRSDRRAAAPLLPSDAFSLRSGTGAGQPASVARQPWRSRRRRADRTRGATPHCAEKRRSSDQFRATGGSSLPRARYSSTGVWRLDP
jgi:hypothetical protein